MRSLVKDRTSAKDPQGQAGRKNRGFRERGAVSVLFVLLIPVLFGAMAVALDFGRLIYEQQHLSKAIDAAALAAAPDLPDTAAAEVTAKKFAKINDAQADPAVTFWCVVASSGAGLTPAVGQIPTVCNPGSTVGAQCNETICAIVCPASYATTCNTVTVTDDKDVPFSFAPVIGINTGNTGVQEASACKGSCGALTPNPMDVAIVADRTGSMATIDRNKMVAAILKTLQTMTKEQQYVALGTIHRSAESPGACITAPSGSATTGPWIPVPFSDDYTLMPAIPGTTPPLNPASKLNQGLSCLSASSKGTYLAAPMKAAARYVLGKDSNNLSSLPLRSHPARKAIIFETDGMPNETTIAGSTSINVAGDIGSSNGNTACNNLLTVATNAKAQGVIIVTVAFGEAKTAQCGGSTGAYVRNVLAAAASPHANGSPSVADSDCSSAAKRDAENSDGDFFFCAADGDELGPIFVSAINAISPHTRLIRIP